MLLCHMENDRSQRFPGRPTRAKDHDELQFDLLPDDLEIAYHRRVKCEECGASAHGVFVPNRSEYRRVDDHTSGESIVVKPIFQVGFVHVACSCGHNWSEELGNYDDWDHLHDLGVANILQRQ